jgi:hypothetical protein
MKAIKELRLKLYLKRMLPIGILRTAEEQRKLNNSFAIETNLAGADTLLIFSPFKRFLLRSINHNMIFTQSDVLIFLTSLHE